MNLMGSFWFICSVGAILGWCVAFIATFFWSHREGKLVWQGACLLLTLASIARLILIAVPFFGGPGTFRYASPDFMILKLAVELPFLACSLAGVTALTLAITLYSPRVRTESLK